ncbi:MAG: hypothetical protein AAGI22_11205 [Planctomycetota bacterium]
MPADTPRVSIYVMPPEVTLTGEGESKIDDAKDQFNELDGGEARPEDASNRSAKQDMVQIQSEIRDAVTTRLVRGLRDCPTFRPRTNESRPAVYECESRVQVTGLSFVNTGSAWNGFLSQFGLNASSDTLGLKISVTAYVALESRDEWGETAQGSTDYAKVVAVKETASGSIWKGKERQDGEIDISSAVTNEFSRSEIIRAANRAADVAVLEATAELAARLSRSIEVAEEEQAVEEEAE